MTNSLLMALVFYFYHRIRVSTKNPSGQFILIFLWIAFEYLHLDWDLSWPWLNLGNGFAAYPKWIQWYEYTGVFGGTFWILLVNILLFKAITPLLFKEPTTRLVFANAISGLLFILLPLLGSLKIYSDYQEESRPVNISIIQPNNDPYSEQYELTPKEVLSHIFKLADSVSNDSTQFVVCPESAIQERPLYENHIYQGKSIRMLQKYLAEKHNQAFIIGASTYYIFDQNEPLPLSARKFSDADLYYNAYNTAIYMDNHLDLQLYHKSKLTPGVEKMPFKSVFNHVENFAIDLGGTVGTLGTDSLRTPFHTFTGNKIAPVICYESVYGDFLTGFVKNGAEAMLIITNDGWWGDTGGYRQHMAYASLRAIETRRSIARSANTGISAFIDQRGDVIKATPYWKETAINGNINLNNKMTFYVKYGDFIGRIALFGSVLLILMGLSARLMRK